MKSEQEPQLSEHSHTTLTSSAILIGKATFFTAMYLTATHQEITTHIGFLYLLGLALIISPMFLED